MLLRQVFQTAVEAAYRGGTRRRFDWYENGRDQALARVSVRSGGGSYRKRFGERFEPLAQMAEIKHWRGFPAVPGAVVRGGSGGTVRSALYPRRGYRAGAVRGVAAVRQSGMVRC